MDLETEIIIPKQHEICKSWSSISILKNKEWISEAVKVSTPIRSTVITKEREGRVHKFENKNCRCFGWKIKFGIELL